MPENIELIRPVSFGRLRLAGNLALAPMHKRTHLAMRLLSRRAGAALAHTEMATPEDLLGVTAQRKGANILASSDEDRPLGVQIVPRNAGPLAEAIAMLVERNACDLVDLNFACPSKRVAGSGRGAAFLRDPEAAIRLVETAVQGGRAAAKSRGAGRTPGSLEGGEPMPITLKLRLGWTDSAEHRALALELARGAAAVGVAGITLHGRSALQQYHGQADWATIRQWAETLPVPVFGSGDLRSPEAVVRMLAETGCAGASLARGATGAPWLFRQVIELASAGSYRPVTTDERARAFWEHYEGLVLQYGERIAIRYMRQVSLMYTRGIRGAPEARTAIQHAGGPDDLRAIMEKYFRE
jgi:tRNA-dihydrouridine synthase B